MYRSRSSGCSRRASRSEVLGAGCAGELLPAGVEEDPPAAGVGHPDQGGGEVGHRGEPFLGLAADPAELEVRADAGHQLLGGERLDQVVVGAGRQPLDGRLLAGAGGQQQHRHAGGPRVGAERGQQPHPVQPRHHHVADDEVRRRGAARPPARPARRAPPRRVARSEQPVQVVAHVGVVVGDQHPPRRAGQGSAPASTAATAGRRRRPPPGSQRSASATNGAAAADDAGPPGVPGDLFGRQVRRARGGADDERGADVRLALGGDRAPVQAHQLAHHGQADAAALTGAGPGAARRGGTARTAGAAPRPGRRCRCPATVRTAASPS